MGRAYLGLARGICGVSAPHDGSYLYGDPRGRRTRGQTRSYPHTLVERRNESGRELTRPEHSNDSAYARLRCDGGRLPFALGRAMAALSLRIPVAVVLARQSR
jgi:hypothetical protein